MVSSTQKKKKLVIIITPRKDRPLSNFLYILFYANNDFRWATENMSTIYENKNITENVTDCYTRKY